MTFTEFLVCAFNVNNHQNIYYIKRLIRSSVWGFYTILSISDEKYHSKVLGVYCSFVCNAWRLKSLSYSRLRDVHGEKCLSDLLSDFRTHQRQTCAPNFIPRKFNKLYYILINISVWFFVLCF